MWNSQWNPLNEVYLLSKFDVFSFSMTGDIQIFKLVIFLTLSSSKLIVIFLTLGNSKWTLLVHFFLLWAGQLFYFGQDIRLQKTTQTLSNQKFKNYIFFNDSFSRNQELGPSVNKQSKLQRFNILFLSIKGFSDLFDKVKYA